MGEYLVEKEFEYNGLKCVVVLQRMGHRCGYVGLPSTNPLYGEGYDHVDYIDVHGGLTYSGGGKDSDYPIGSDLWWFGFDCAHWDDKPDFDAVMKGFDNLGESFYRFKEHDELNPNSNEHVRTTEFVEEECKRLADQLLELTIN